MDAPPGLQAAIPILLTGDLAASVAFFERLGFARRYNDDAYAILDRTASSFTSVLSPASTRSRTTRSAASTSATSRRSTPPSRRTPSTPTVPSPSSPTA